MSQLSEPGPDGPRLSLCMIVKDEADQLERCLKSVAGWVEQIVVVDTGSADETKEIARRCGAAVHEFEWCDDFAAARNFSLDQADSDWIFFLDADEELAPGSGALLRQAIHHPGMEGFLCHLICLFNSRDQLSGNTIPVLRLFRRRRQYRFCGRIHEQIAPAILQGNGAQKISFAPIIIKHYGYQPDTCQAKHKAERNLQLLRRQLAETGPSPMLYFYIGTEYYAAHQDELALEYLRKAEAAAASPGRSGAPDQDTLLILHNILLNLFARGHYEEIVARVALALPLYPGYTDLYFFRGHALFQLKKAGRAWNDFCTCLKLGDAGFPYPATTGCGSFQAWNQFGLYYQASGNRYLAKRTSLESLRINPWQRQVWQSLRNLIQAAPEPGREWRLFQLFSLDPLLPDLAAKLLAIEFFHEMAGWNWVCELLKPVQAPEITGQNAASYHAWLGCGYFFTHHWEQAFTCLARVPEAEADSFPYHFQAFPILKACLCGDAIAAATGLNALETGTPLFRFYHLLLPLLLEQEKLPENSFADPAFSQLLPETMQSMIYLGARQLFLTLLENCSGQLNSVTKVALIQTLIFHDANELALEILRIFTAPPDSVPENSKPEQFRTELALSGNPSCRGDALSVLRQALTVNPPQVRLYVGIIAKLSDRIRETFRKTTAFDPELPALFGGLTRRSHP